MNEQTNDTQAGEDEPAMGTVNELDVLKQRARMMGVEFSNNIGVETLRERIRVKAEEQSNATAAPAPALFDPALTPAATHQTSPPKNPPTSAPPTAICAETDTANKS